MPDLFTAAELTEASDVDLEHALARLYLTHAEADSAGRAEAHAGIMQLLGEMRTRTDAWLAAHG
jgi:hypothetical protein